MVQELVSGPTQLLVVGEMQVERKEEFVGELCSTSHLTSRVFSRDRPLFDLVVQGSGWIDPRKVSKEYNEVAVPKKKLHL